MFFPDLPPFGSKMLLVALTPMGRLYFDRWRAFEGKDPYILTGFEKTEPMTRAGAVHLLKTSGAQVERWAVNRRGIQTTTLRLPAREAR